MFGYDWPRLHAALNDLPAALLLATVLFDLGTWATKRESLRSAALWTLWAGVVGGWGAVVAGLQAEDVIDHGKGIHDLMEPHETWAFVTMAVFTVVLVYKLFRRGNLTRTEELLGRGLSLAGLVTLIYTARLGGTMFFEHAAGVPTAVFEPEARDRAQRKHRHTGEGAGTDRHDDTVTDSASVMHQDNHDHDDHDRPHTHPPDHKH
jgi:uncharacterized membrane protein